MYNWKKSKKARTIAAVVIIVLVAAMILAPILSYVIK